MSREYIPYAMFDCTFLLSDPRYTTLPPSAKVLYVSLWARARLERRELLQNWYDTRAMQGDSSLDARTVRKCVAILLQKCLIEQAEDGRIRVVGVKTKGNIKWKDDGESFSPTVGENETQNEADKNRIEQNIFKRVWETWVGAGIQDNRIVCGPNEVQAIKAAATHYNQGDIVEAIQKYAEILRGEEYILTTRWTLKSFLEKHMSKFLNGSKPEEMYLLKGRDGRPTGKRRPPLKAGESVETTT